MSERVVRYLAAGMADVPPHDDWMSGPERERIAGFRYTKRRDETRLGRWTAKRAIAQVLDRSDDADGLQRLVVRNAADGAPEAFEVERPLPIRISMTDRADWAVCVVAIGDVGIGCDLEVVEPRSDRFVADYFTGAEQALVAARPGEMALLANLIWSAKESALKVLRTGLRRDTRSVEVSLPPDESVDGWARLRVTTDEGLRFDGWWCRFGQFILTCAADRPILPPTSLVEPAALLAAEPTHRWMANPRPPAPN